VGNFERKFQECPLTTFSVRKLESLGYHVACLRDPTFSRFDTIPACDRQTDRQAHTHAQTQWQTHDDGCYPHIASAARV